MTRAEIARLVEENAKLRRALEKILDTEPRIVLNGNARVGDPDAIDWNVHMDAKEALAPE